MKWLNTQKADLNLTFSGPFWIRLGCYLLTRKLNLRASPRLFENCQFATFKLIPSFLLPEPSFSNSDESQIFLCRMLVVNIKHAIT